MTGLIIPELGYAFLGIAVRLAGHWGLEAYQRRIKQQVSMDKVEAPVPKAPPSTSDRLFDDIVVAKPELKIDCIGHANGTSADGVFPDVGGRLLQVYARVEVTIGEMTAEAVELDIGEYRLPAIKGPTSFGRGFGGGDYGDYYFRFPDSARAGRREVRLIVWANNTPWGSQRFGVTIPAPM